MVLVLYLYQVTKRFEILVISVLSLLRINTNTLSYVYVSLNCYISFYISLRPSS